MPDAILPAPFAAPRLTRAIVLPSPFAGPLGAIAPVYASAGTGGGAVFYRAIVLSAGAAAPLKRMEAGRNASGVIIPRAFAGPRLASGVLIPRRKAASGNVILADDDLPMLAGNGIELLWGDEF